MNKSKLSISLFVAVLFTLGFVPYLSQEAFAAEPQFSSFVADDPDDLDTILSNGDTLTITFDVATNATNNGAISQAELAANFTDTNIGGDAAVDWGTTFSGVWNADSTILTVTLTDVTGATLTIGTSEIEGRTTTNISSAAVGTNADLLDSGASAPATLSGDFGLFVAATSGNGSGCNNCEAPTLGINENGRRIVDDGFAYNGNSIDVERYFTPYPLVTVNVGKQNVAEFKIYDDKGPDSVSHFELAFGLASGESIGKSNAVINWDRSFDGIETITLDDPENVLDKIKVTTSEGYCSDESQTKCLIVKVTHTFRAPLDFNILGTNVWDIKRNAWQNYYNHGIEVVGESLNPPKEYDGINKGQIYHLTETSKTTAIDEFGNSWSLKYDSWEMDYVMTEKIKDTSSIMTRTHSEFPQLKVSQANYAIEQLLVLCPTCLMPYADFEDSSGLEYSERIERINNLELQQDMIFESERAQKIMNQIFDPSSLYD